MVTLGVTYVFTSAVIGVDVAVVGLAQGEDEVRVTTTTSPSFKEDDEKVSPVPALVPFTVH
jgi:hypothetical protein